MRKALKVIQLKFDIKRPSKTLDCFLNAVALKETLFYFWIVCDMQSRTMTGATGTLFGLSRQK